MREHFSPGHVALGTFDAMTFGVPLGFSYLAAGAGHGVSSLYQGRYEQAARELAPAALMVGLYAGGKGVRSLSEAKVAAGIGDRGVRLQVPELRLQVLKEVVERLRERLAAEVLLLEDADLRKLERHRRLLESSMQGQLDLLGQVRSQMSSARPGNPADAKELRVKPRLVK